MRKLLEALNPFSPSSLHVELRGSVAHHVRQIDRARVPQVDSAIEARHEWAVNLNVPGKYIHEGRA